MAKKSAQQRITFDLLGNAKDSLEHAVDHLTANPTPQSSDFKRVILDITHVVELLLKERLKRLHPALIWEKIDEYPNDEKRTVNTDLALQRVQKICNLEFSQETKDILLMARKVRNSIEHYQIDIEENEAKIIIGRLLNFIFDFTNRALEEEWEESFKEDKKWKILILFKEFYEVLAKRVKERIRNEKIQVYLCPLCEDDSFNLNSGTCLLCGHAENVFKCDICKNKFPESFIDDFTDSDGPGPLVCSECQSTDENEYSD